ncbi:MAG: oligoendopeptidase F [Desulfobacterales bacterium]|jgi:oligoendopeptidase F
MPKKMIPKREDIPPDQKWDLTPIFERDDQWEKLYHGMEKEIQTYASFRGRLGESVTRFKEALAFHLAVWRRIEKLYTYTHLKSDEDKSNQFYAGLHQRAVRLYTRASELSSFVTPEIQKLPDETVRNFLADDCLAEYRFFLEKIFRYKPHTLDETIEEILAMSREVAQAPAHVFGQLDNVDIKFGTLVDAAGNEVELSHGNFSTFLLSPDRQIRKTAFFQYYQAYEDHKHTMAATLTHSIKKDYFYARVRKFNKCRAAALFGDNVAESVYDNLIETVKRNLDPLFKYLHFRKQALGLPDLHPYDTYVPIVRDIDFHMSYETAVETCVNALKPLGPEYSGILNEGLVGRWVDRYENKGKRSGAYSSGCYDSPPYILLNYEKDNINSLYTLIHEAGHAMHSYYANTNQPYVDHEYTIFVAEVASTFNEALLSEYLFRRYADEPNMKAYILNREIDNIRATLFRQTMFAEFEEITHKIIEDNSPLTLEVITDTYRQLLEVYFGDTMALDPELHLECLRIPHFYSAFYVYKYATGISAAIMLADKVLQEGDSARQDYINLLKAGGSKFPLEELLDAGVDMHSPAPIERAIAYFEKLVDQLIVEYKKLT